MLRTPLALVRSLVVVVAVAALLLAVLIAGRAYASTMPAVESPSASQALKPAHTITYTFPANNQGWDVRHPYQLTSPEREPAGWNNGHVQASSWNYNKYNVLYFISPGFHAPNGYAAISGILSFTHQVSFDGSPIQDLRYWVWLGSTKSPYWMCSEPRAMSGGAVSLTINPKQSGWLRCPGTLGKTPSEPITEAEDRKSVV